MAVQRMNREQFFRVMSAHDDAQLRKALWNLYWRGTAEGRDEVAESPMPPPHFGVRRGDGTGSRSSLKPLRHS